MIITLSLSVMFKIFFQGTLRLLP